MENHPAPAAGADAQLHKGSWVLALPHPTPRMSQEFVLNPTLSSPDSMHFPGIRIFKMYVLQAYFHVRINVTKPPA
jgi:hypothetical protein